MEAVFGLENSERDFRIMHRVGQSCVINSDHLVIHPHSPPSSLRHPPPPPAPPREDSLTILHFNDVYNIEGRDKEPVGGAARFKTCLERFGHLNPLTLFSGDALSPSNSKCHEVLLCSVAMWCVLSSQCRDEGRANGARLELFEYSVCSLWQP